MRVEAMGLAWIMSAPDASLAGAVGRLKTAGSGAGDIIAGLLADAMTADEWGRLIDELESNEDLPDDYLLELFYCWLEEWSGKPATAVLGLCQILVENWGMVRGKLVLSGIPDPVRQVPLLALLDAVEVLVRETHKDEKESQRFTRELYKPRAKRGAAGGTSHKGFSREELEAQARALSAITG